MHFDSHSFRHRKGTCLSGHYVIIHACMPLSLHSGNQITVSCHASACRHCSLKRVCLKVCCTTPMTQAATMTALQLRRFPVRRPKQCQRHKLGVLHHLRLEGLLRLGKESDVDHAVLLLFVNQLFV